MLKRKKICLFGNKILTTQQIYKQIMHFLGDFVDVKVWTYEEDKTCNDFCKNSDLYIASSYTTLGLVENNIPLDKDVVVADRTLDTKNLENILELMPGTKVIVVGNSTDTAEVTIELMQKLGITYLDFIPYYPGAKKIITKDVEVAISTGPGYPTPPQIKKTINLGAKRLDLSTFVEVILHLGLPKDIINNISQYYLGEIFNLSILQKDIAHVNETLKRKLEVIIDTVDEAMLAIDNEDCIIFINKAAEHLFNLNGIDVIGNNFFDIFNTTNLKASLHSVKALVDDIQSIGQNQYVVNANPFLDHKGVREGTVLTFKAVKQVQELDTKVRQELKKSGHIAKYTFSHIIAKDKSVQNTIALAKKFAITDLSILIQSESGTGKELFAQSIHNLSLRSNGPFVAVNFAALPENLVESELFGYEDGAFTGAKKGGRRGLFEEAHRGTIFLDEIGDSTLDVQKKLLRVLEEQEVRRIGSRVVTPIDTRIIAATNQDLESLVDKGLFRSDLFYRLCTLPLKIPPLRDRGEDIFILIDYFAHKFYNRKVTFEPNVRQFLKNYSWPGNIRELENVVKYFCSIVTRHQAIQLSDLPDYLLNNNTKKNVINYTHKSLDNFNSQFEMAIKELNNQNALQFIIIILKEILHHSNLNKGLGRSSLTQKLFSTTGFFCPDHKIRHWLNFLTSLGFIESGITKQGTRITSLGIEFLNYLERYDYIKSNPS